MKSGQIQARKGMVMLEVRSSCVRREQSPMKGVPVMCAIIIAGTIPKGDVETGINVFSEVIGDPTDEDYLQNNCGKGRQFPGGPTCEVNGILVPCFIRWSENGSITSEILKEDFETLDKLGVFPRHDGVTPFSLLDAHNSRVELPFLTYITTPPHEWVVTIGTPYGTAYWQVGDSKEQNGSFKMAITQAKSNLMKMKGQKMMNKQLSHMR